MSLLSYAPVEVVHFGEKGWGVVYSGRSGNKTIFGKGEPKAGVDTETPRSSGGRGSGGDCSTASASGAGAGASFEVETETAAQTKAADPDSGGGGDDGSDSGSLADLAEGELVME